MSGFLLQETDGESFFPLAYSDSLELLKQHVEQENKSIKWETALDDQEHGYVGEEDIPAYIISPIEKVGP